MNIESLISEDKLEEAIQQLIDFKYSGKQSDLRKEIFLISGWMNHLNRQVRLKLIESEKAQISRNQIRYSLLELYSKIDVNSILLEKQKLTFTEYFNLARHHRNEINEIISTIAIYLGKHADSVTDENLRLDKLLKVRKSKENFNKIEKLFKESAIRLRNHVILVIPELDNFKESYFEMLNSYNRILLIRNELSRKETKEVKTSIESLSELVSGYKVIRNELKKSVEISEKSIEINSFPYYKRAVKKYMLQQNKFVDYMNEYIILIEDIVNDARKMLRR